MEKEKSAVDKLIAKYNQHIKGRLSSAIPYSQVVSDLEELKEEMKQEQSQEKENQSLQEFINSQPYYGHCNPEYLEGIEVGAKWQEEQSKEMEKEALAIIRKFINEFDKQGEVSWNTRDEAENFLNNL